jgi:cytochrome c
MATFAEAPKGNEKAGEKIFKTKCAQCHAVDKAAGHKQGNFLHLLRSFFVDVSSISGMIYC